MEEVMKESEVSSVEILFANHYGDRMRDIYSAVAAGLDTASAISESLGVPMPQVRTYLGRLVNARWVYRPARGYYALAVDGVPFVVEDYDAGRKARSVIR
jgi:hypothetical protein